MRQDLPIIVALDYESAGQAIAMARQLDPSCCRLKVGKELFTACGPPLVEQLQGYGFEIFLDLKFHDIPNTVAKAVLAAARMGVWMVNVHASGGIEMMQTTKAALKAKGGHQPLLTAVTVLGGTCITPRSTLVPLPCLSLLNFLAEPAAVAPCNRGRRHGLTFASKFNSTS